MSYEEEFRMKEKEFTPRNKFSHLKVIDELANIVKLADLEIDELDLEIDELLYLRKLKKADEWNLVLSLCLSVILNTVLIYALI